MDNDGVIIEPSGDGQHAAAGASGAPESVAKTTTTTAGSVATPQATQPEPGTTSVGALMDALGIPESVREHLSVKDAQKDEKPSAESAAADEEAEPPQSVAETDEAGAAEEQTDEQEPQEQQTQEQQRPNKYQKRINRLTRQKSELEEALRAKEAQLEELRQKLESQEPQKLAAAPPGRGPLAYVADERELSQEVQKAEALIEFCDEHPDGVTVDAGKTTERFVDSTEIAKWRRAAEKVLLHAPLRRDELRAHNAQRQKSDEIAMQICPQLFESGSEENKAAAALLRMVPEVAGRPDINHLAALVIEGIKAVQARSAASANGEKVAASGANGSSAGRSSDVKSRLLAARAPVAPHVANPPVDRSESLSGVKRLKEAVDKLVEEPGTDRVKRIADVLGALDSATGAAGSRRKQVVT